jgi:toxin ParE1/3/4
MRRLTFTRLADQDLVGLRSYTLDKFGTAARARYDALLSAAIRDLLTTPERPGSIARPDMGPALWTYHLRSSRAYGKSGVRSPRHLLLYRFDTEQLEIIRILHDAMELRRHIPADDES